MGTHMPYGITQCYLPPDRGNIPDLTPAEAGTQFSDPRGWVVWKNWLWFTYVTDDTLFMLLLAFYKNNNSPFNGLLGDSPSE